MLPLKTRAARKHRSGSVSGPRVTQRPAMASLGLRCDYDVIVVLKVPNYKLFPNTACHMLHVLLATLEKKSALKYTFLSISPL